jgi:hypothetical protein
LNKITNSNLNNSFIMKVIKIRKSKEHAKQFLKIDLWI